MRFFIAILYLGLIFSCKTQQKNPSGETAISTSNDTSSSAREDLTIIDKPIIFDEERKKLSLQYLKVHHELDLEEPVIEPRIIVIHHTVIPTFEATYRTFYPALLPSHREGIKNASSLNVSSQFVVDRDGTIYRLLPETTFARHVIGLNYCAIGVENVGGTPETPLTEAQAVANIQLVRYLKDKYPIQFLIGHHEYQTFKGSQWWKESDPNYLTQKSDPGNAFMEQIRDVVEDLGLKARPE